MDITSQGFWLFVFQMLQGIGQIGSVAVAFYVLYLVQDYTRGKDAADQKRNFNESWQFFNELAIREDNIETYRHVWFPEGDKTTIKRRLLFFIVLNNLHNAYSGNVHGIFSDEFWRSSAEDQARVLSPYREEVENLLDNYGYEPSFVRIFKDFLKKAAALRVQNSAVAGRGTTD